MSGNNVYEPHNATGILPNDSLNLYVPVHVGIGCVTSGPFKDMSTNLGPDVPIPSANQQTDGLEYDPKCLGRDISSGLQQVRQNTKVMQYCHRALHVHYH